MRRPHYRLCSLAFAGVLIAASCSVPAVDQLADDQAATLTFCEAMTQPLDFGVVSLDDFGGDEQAVEVDRFASGDERVDVIVFMNPDATDNEIAGARTALDAFPAATIVSFFDQADALREFRERFRDDEQISSAVALSDMPTSFRVDLVPPEGESVHVTKQEFGVEGEQLAGVFDIILSPGLRIEPIELAGTTLADLLLELPLRSRLNIFLNPSSAPADLIAIEQAVIATGARYSVYSQARTFEEFQAMQQARPGFEARDMSPSVRVEQADGLTEFADAVRREAPIFEIRGSSSGRSRDTVTEIQRRFLSELLTRPAVERMRSAASRTAPDQKPDLTLLATDLDDSDETYQVASTLRDRLLDECGVSIDVSNRARPLHETMSKLLQFGNQ